MHPAAHPDSTATPRNGARPEAPPAATGLAEWNLATDEVLWSPEVFALFGRDRDAGGLTLDQLPAQLLPEDQLPLQGMVTAALVDGHALVGEFRIVRPDGTVRAVRCSGGPVMGGDGHAESLRLSLRDLGGPNGPGFPGGPGGVRGRGEARSRPPAAPAPGPGPSAPPELAARGPADGGDGWADAFPLPGGGALLALGGPAGPAAGGGSGPAVLRDALRGMAMTGAEPARMLRLLDRMLPQCGSGGPVAALCCRYEAGDPGRPAVLAWAQAGLRGPLVLRGGAAVRLPAGSDRGRPLGGPSGGGHGAGRTELRRGDVVLCWTGGPDGADGPEGGAPDPADLADVLGPRVAGAGSAAECADLALGLLRSAAGERPGAALRLAVLRVG
ncbi:SpoIIE family protein phosphatase [Streptomyces sp. NPDC001380]|uniref:SpoIIE family protein phosphatase n=1 Tax=Streptomyces sp. NPDC001380 TaxID=3364566 RepID=UPI0036C34E3B